MKIVIVGDGKVGLTLTQMLTEEEHDVTVIDSNPRVLARLQHECDAMVVQGHGASRAVLEEAGAGEADLLIAATSSDEINLLSCLTSNKMGCKNTIARVRSPEYAEDIDFLREDLGLSFAINPEETCAREIYNLLQFPSFIGREQFAKGRVEIVRLNICAGSPLENIPLSGLYAAAKVKVLVCAVDRESEVIIPDGNFVIREGDDLFITAGSDHLATLIKNLGLATHKVTQVTIVGGSRLGLYLSYHLLRSGVGVKIIEKDAERCVRLAELLPDADIVEADGTEQETLLSENVAHTDALVSLIGIDEENIVLSMYARQLGVPRIVTKCNRSQYTNMFRKMGIDMVVSSKASCAQEIVRYVRAMENSTGTKMITMYRIANGMAEALEFKADDSCRLIGPPLSKLSLKKGMLIACVSRGRSTIIPTGDTVIQSGDRVVVVTAQKGIYELNEILAVEKS